MLGPLLIIASATHLIFVLGSRDHDFEAIMWIQANVRITYYGLALPMLQVGKRIRRSVSVVHMDSLTVHRHTEHLLSRHWYPGVTPRVQRSTVTNGLSMASFLVAK